MALPGARLGKNKKTSLIETDKALGVIIPEWQRLFYNIELSKHIEEVQHVLNRHSSQDDIKLIDLDLNAQERSPRYHRGSYHALLLYDLLCKSSPISFTSKTPEVLGTDAGDTFNELHNNNGFKTGFVKTWMEMICGEPSG